MMHAPVVPIVLPLLVGALLLLPLPARLRQSLGLASCLAQLLWAFFLLQQADSGVLQLYTLGNWTAPFGISLLVDRLSAALLLTTALLGLAALIYAERDQRLTPVLQALFQFQLMGINGAFLTFDLFNLFVFFEILLASSYALLLHGLSRAQVASGVHYVLLNLAGSALFLIGLGVVYGAAGTLNMADVARQIASAGPAQAPLLAAAGLLLMVVFALKAALFPLAFWLPATYASATPAVAALFSILTKVGVYAIWRLCTVLYGPQAGLLADLLEPWLWPLALAGMLLAAVGALAARDLPKLVAYLVVLSAGTLLAALALRQPQAQSAALYYLLHSTWVSGALFLLAGLIGAQRGALACALQAGPRLAQHSVLAVLFALAALAMVGLPPFPGFIGKALLLQSAAQSGHFALWWVLLIAALAALTALLRAGTTLFWKATEPAVSQSLDKGQLFACGLLLAGVLALLLLSQEALGFAQRTAAQLADSAAYQALVEGH